MALKIALFFLGAALYSAFAINPLPGVGEIAPDSESYLNFMSIRPPGYPLYLRLHQAVFGGLSHLPALHAVAYFSGVSLLAVAVSLRVGSILPAPLIFLAGAQAPFLWFEAVMSEPLFTAQLTSGMASLVLFGIAAANRRTGWAQLALGFASLLIGCAAATRTTGFVALAIVVIGGAGAVWSGWAGPRKARGAALLITPALLVLLFGATANKVQNGAFAIGSYGGMSLFGKALLLARPLPPENPLSAANAAAVDSPAARKAVQAAPSLALRVLLVRQYYDYLRFEAFWSRASETWPAWQHATEKEINELAGRLSSAYIAEDLQGYAELVALDYASYWLSPGILTRNEAARLTREYESMGGVPFLPEFAEARPGAYFSIVPPPQRTAYVLFARSLTLGFLLLSVAWLCHVSWSALAHGARPAWDLLILVLTVHATIAAMSLSEAALERYVAPLWPLMASASALIIGEAAVRLHRAARQRGTISRDPQLDKS